MQWGIGSIIFIVDNAYVTLKEDIHDSALKVKNKSESRYECESRKGFTLFSY